MVVSKSTVWSALPPTPARASGALAISFGTTSEPGIRRNVAPAPSRAATHPVATWDTIVLGIADSGEVDPPSEEV
jgi:hypothetical protein